MLEKVSEKRFYVYALLRPWNRVPCYIGKGQNFRVHDHAIMGEFHYNRHLANIFKKAGGALPFEIIWETDEEAEAFAYEIDLIFLIGRSDKGLGPLCNMTDGGDGPSGIIQSEEAKQNRREKSTEMWNRDGFRENRAQKDRIRWNREGEREAQSQRLTESWKKPGRRTEASQKSSEVWNRPGYRETQSASRKGKSPFSSEQIEENRIKLVASWAKPEVRELRLKRRQEYEASLTPEDREARRLKSKEAQTKRRERERLAKEQPK